MILFEQVKRDRPTKCCLCGKTFVEFGNNPWPLAKKGRCYDMCNWTKVIPARVKPSNKETDKNNLRIKKES